MNETCDVNLNYLTFNGITRQSQKQVLLNQGLSIVDSSQNANYYHPNHRSIVNQQAQNAYGKVQMIPGSSRFSNKAQFAKLMQQNENNKYLPKYYILPQDLQLLEEESKNYTGQYIFKPDNQLQGIGINLANNITQLKQIYKQYVNKHPKHKTAVVQHYYQSRKIDGRKFDIRILLVQTSIDPVSVYVYKDGFIRFSSVQYNQTNLDNYDISQQKIQQMIVTNSHAAERNLDRRHRNTWRMNEYIQYMKNNDPKFNEDEFWEQVHDIAQSIFNKDIIKFEMDSEIVQQEHPSQYFRQYGIDLLPLEDGTYKLLEFNHNPSDKTIFQSEQRLYDEFYNDLINLASIRPKKAEIQCDEKCKQQFLDKVFDNKLSDDEKIALLQLYDERWECSKFIPIKPLDELKQVGQYNKALINYWDKIDQPFNQTVVIN